MKKFDFLKEHQYFSLRNNPDSSRTCDFYFDVRSEKGEHLERGFISIYTSMDPSLPPTFKYFGPGMQFTEDETAFSPWFLQIKREVETQYNKLIRIRELFKQKDLS